MSKQGNHGKIEMSLKPGDFKGFCWGWANVIMEIVLD